MIAAMPPSSLPRGFSAMGVFLFFGATMAALAAITLLWPGTPLDHAWALNPRAHKELAPLGPPAGAAFLVLAAALALAGTGWFRRRRWAWWLATAIIATQIAGNLVNLVLKRYLEGAVGITIAGALLAYLLSRNIRGVFCA